MFEGAVSCWKMLSSYFGSPVSLGSHVAVEHVDVP